MKLRYLYLIALLSLAAHAQVNLTSVSALVQDVNSSKYVNCTYVVDFVQNPNQTNTYTYGGNLNFQRQYVQNKCDSFGNLSIQLPDSVNAISPNDSTWRFTICSAHGYVPGDQYCFKVELSITGATDNISAAVQAAAAILPVSGLLLQTNTVNNTSQGNINFVNSATVIWTNPSDGVEQATSTGLACSPVTANSVVYINNSGACTTSGNLVFFASSNQLIVGTSGSGSPGFIQANATANTHGATFTTTANGDQIILGGTTGQLGSVAPLIVAGDTSLSPINYLKFTGGLAAGSAVGFEWVGGGDTSGSGSAAGFKVVNAANTLDNSPGANNSITAGNSVGSSANGNHGGDNIFTAGSYTSAANNRGGDDVLTAGNSSGTGRGGNITLNPGTGTPNGAVIIGNVTGSTQCLQVSTTGAVSGTGSTSCQGVTKDFSVTGCTTAASTDSNCTGTITISPAFADAAYIPQLTVNSINGAFMAVSVSGSLAAGSIPYTLTCTFNCATIVAPTIYIHAFHP